MSLSKKLFPLFFLFRFCSLARTPVNSGFLFTLFLRTQKKRKALCLPFAWRRKRDSNPRGLSPKRFSRPPRYDRFDIPASFYLIVFIPKRFDARLFSLFRRFRSLQDTPHFDRFDIPASFYLIIVRFPTLYPSIIAVFYKNVNDYPQV